MNLFQGDKKFGQSILHTQEDWLKQRLIPLVPRGIETHHLTLLSIAWSLLVIAFSYLARRNLNWLWAVSAMITAQYITDLLDGAIGRLRNTGLVKWGFYMDHFLDFMFLCAILIGYAILIPQAFRTNLFFIMALFMGFMVHAFLSFAATNRFQIAYMGFGPTEMRIGFILVNFVILQTGAMIIVKVMPFLLIATLFALFISVYRFQQELWRIDMAAKYGHALPAPQPPSRHRKRFIICLVLALAGIYCLWLPSVQPLWGTAAIVLLTASATLLLAAAADLHRVRQSKRLFKSAILVYAPYWIMALLLIAALRIWLVLEPTEITPLRPEAVSEAPCTATLAPSVFGEPGLDDPLALLAAWDAFVDESAEQARFIAVHSGFLSIDAITYPREHKLAVRNFFSASLALTQARLTFLEVVPRAAQAQIDAARQGAFSALRRETLSDKTIIRLFAAHAYYKALFNDSSLDAAFRETVHLWSRRFFRRWRIEG
jgi:archaetidylinositol phosphate synthase